MDIKYAQVIIDNRASQTDKPYTYIIPEDIIDIIEEGMRVLIPFGRGNRVIKGIIIKIQDSYEQNYKLKSIIDTIDDEPLISRDMIDLSLWMSEYYLSPYLDSLQTVLPPGDFKKVKTYLSLKEKDESTSKLDLSKLEYNVLNTIKSAEGRMDLETLKSKLESKNINPTIKSLKKKGFINTTLEVKTSVKKKYDRYISLVDKSISHKSLIEKIGTRAYKQLEIGEYLLSIDEILLKTLMKNLNTSLSTIRELEKKGIVKFREKEVYRTPIKKEIDYYKKHKLSRDQEHCFHSILNNIKRNAEQNKFLIHGVTGSGKTEIYLQLVEEMMKMGKETIILVPEIALTPQTIDRFVGRFGEEVAVLHSKLSHGERFDQWRKIKEGQVKIVVGARSAVFAPFKNLGLIVIDEEHETTYKSSMNPKYNTIEVAEKRCDQVGAYLVKGSATPSLESYYKGRNNDIQLLKLEKRINNKSLPEVNIRDMREELSQGNKSIFSKALYNKLKENLQKQKQTILFLNRRGYSTFISCRECGYVVECDECDVSMTYHMKNNKLKCHYCGLAINPPKICPVCKSKYIKYFGIGTERVEEYTRRVFPNARIARMDMDTTTKKGSHESILGDMKNGKIDILIGTQMVAKGLDFEDVTLVGVIAADTSLNLPDFRSSERTFQLITQVAGRAGRGEFKGEVIVQTYNPDHFSIQHAKEHDYLSFYEEEIILRREFSYPPFTNIIGIVMYGENRYNVEMKTRQIYDLIIREMDEKNFQNINSNVSGPFPAPLEKIKRNYRFQILIKSGDKKLKELKEIIKRVCIDNSGKVNFKGIKFNIDINPNSIL